ncbi:MAG: LysR substrate-binding domain-containing protein [Burkholderiaceae bacterium]
MPPLELLPGFEAAARLLSFSRAAEELFVTQSAVSRQIKTLEDSLGVELFVRGHRSLSLTPGGRELLAVTRGVLDQLREVTAHLRPGEDRHSVTVTTVPGFASLWLIPRLARFAAVAPLVDVRISVSHQLVDLEHEDVDLAVRYCSPYAGVAAVLFEDQFQPVCAPALAEDSARPLREIPDLARHAFLELNDVAGRTALLDWALWLRAVGHPAVVPQRTLSFSHYDSVITAALAGQGIAMGRLPLVDHYLRDGSLVAPFANVHASTKAYCLVVSSRSRMNPAATRFIEWLLEETSADRLRRAESPASALVNH